MKKKRKVGLDKKGRIAWDLPENLLAIVLSRHGLHAKAIGRITGLNPSAIYYRNKKRGVKIKDYRDGKGAIVQQVLSRYNVRSVENMPAADRQRLEKEFGID